MPNQEDACIYNGIEYTITGRSAIKKNEKKTIVEIRPKFCGGFKDELNIWVPPSELYQIIDEVNDNDTI